MNSAPQKKAPSILKVIIAWILIVPIFLLGYPTLFLLGVGMAPTIVSFLVERLPGRPASFSIGCFNLCGNIPYLLLLWQHGQTWHYALELFFDPNTLLTMYGCAFMGFSIFWGVPKVVIGTYRISARTRVKKLKKVQEKLIEEWSEDVRALVLPPPPPPTKKIDKNNAKK